MIACFDLISIRADLMHSISIPACDKNLPGALIAAARHNRPTIIVYGGSMVGGTRPKDCPGMHAKKGDSLNVTSAFEAYGAMLCGKITDEERRKLLLHQHVEPS